MMHYIVCRMLKIDLKFGVATFKVLSIQHSSEYWSDPHGSESREHWRKFNSKEEADVRANKDASCFVMGIND